MDNSRRVTPLDTYPAERPLSDVDDPLDDEGSRLRDHFLELESGLKRLLACPSSLPHSVSESFLPGSTAALSSISAAPCVPLKLKQRERQALRSILNVVCQDMEGLQYGLARASRPVDHRDVGFEPAPDWDAQYLEDLVDHWAQPLHLESDFYLLRSMCLYELGNSALVGRLGRPKMHEYMKMALRLVEKALKVLRTVLESENRQEALEKYWRHHTLSSRIHQKLANLVMSDIRDHELITGLPTSERMYDDARQSVTLAVRSFQRGIKLYPNMTTQEGFRSFKSLEWKGIAETTIAYTKLLDDFQGRQTWAHKSVMFLTGALQEGPPQCRPQLMLDISRVYIDFATWIHQSPNHRLLVIPKVSPVFLEMQFAAVAGKSLTMVSKKHALQMIPNKDLEPRHLLQMVDSCYMLSISCLCPHNIHKYSREAAEGVCRLEASFPWFDLHPAYAHAAKMMTIKDDVMQAIEKKSRDR